MNLGKSGLMQPNWKRSLDLWPRQVMVSIYCALLLIAEAYDSEALVMNAG